MYKHLIRSLISATVLTIFALPYWAYAADAPAKSDYNVIADGGGFLDNTPPPPPKKPKEEAKKTPYDQLPLSQLVEKANANDLTAQFELASRYNYGRTMPKNTVLALKWLRKAATAGQADAQRLLAVKLYNGFDVSPNYQEARKWAEKLAEKGDVAAASMIGSMYANGEGSKRNLPLAYTWYAIAASGNRMPEGDAKITDEQLAQSDLIAQAEEQRDKLASLISAKEEAQAQKKASAWWLKHQPDMEKVRAEKAKKAAEEQAAALAAKKPSPTK